MSLTVGIVAPGAMGSAVGRRLAQGGATVLTSCGGRDASTRMRAVEAGMIDTSDEDIAGRCDLVLSIVPPTEAKALATRFAALLSRPSGPIYVDCNAIGVATMQEIAAEIANAGGRCVDGAILGFPPKADGDGPAFLFSGEWAVEAARLAEHGLTTRVVDGPIGAVSALKLSYAGVAKGLVAIAATMILAADRAGAARGLKAELAASQPQLLERFGRTLPDMYPKAYRWIDEMRSIAAFIGEERGEAQLFLGAAALFERFSNDTEGPKLRAAVDRFLGEAGKSVVGTPAANG